MNARSSEKLEQLAERTLELVNIPSESRSETALEAHIESLLPSMLELVHRDGASLYARTPRSGKPLVVLAGHLDTVPAQANVPGRREEGVITGCGASDMKAGLAVMIELARWIREIDAEIDLDLGFLFFPREELPLSESALPAVFEAVPEISEAKLVIMLEPTDNTIQSGCLGNLNATLVFSGESSHSARPWQGVNAIDRAIEGLQRVAATEPREVTVQGLTFVEVLSLTGIEAGIAENVIPDRCVARLNYRYAPGRSTRQAEESLQKLLGDLGGLTVTSNSPAAHVVVETPLVERLRRAGDLAVEPKQAWTPVAEFSARGLDAVNFGPGATRYAHRADERVEIAQLERSFQTLQRFLTEPG